ncbi:MAG TPA: aromatic ring-hydroxylating dioxygenase subunit alpha [Acidimicrobiales bacterium]|nr:aromatic ring-hydroxylating dioxygenase subunit alpha [Acidimicrobiales bacterium]
MDVTKLDEMLVGDDGRVPKERYVSRAFAELEMERLWPRVWQVACRHEEIPEAGDFVEYRIGDQSILVVRSEDGTVRAFHNSCLHRGTRLAEGCGTFADCEIRCRYHAWRYHLDGRVKEIVDRHEFAGVPGDLRLREVRVGAWGGFVFVTMDPDAPDLLDFLRPIPDWLGPYRLEDMRFYSHKTTVLPANWKVVVDAFNEGYHVQGTHPQILAWTDDVNMEYEQFETHAHYGRLPAARRQLRPSPRLGIADEDVDEWEILAALVGGLGGLFYNDERRIVDELKGAPLPEGRTLMELYQERRRDLLASRGLDVSRFTLDQLTSADDFYWFPNVLGPIYPGTAIMFRVRPDGLDPDSAVMDLWTLQWPGEGWRPCEHKVYPDWTAKDWGLITIQDFANMAHVQEGMKSRGCVDLRLNPRQESNILHMHRVIDRYLTS